MSYIDCFSHTFVGDFLGLPLYHPLVKLDEEGYGAGPEQFVFGGGSGEHALMAITNLPFCVFKFLDFVVDDVNRITNDENPFRRSVEHLYEFLDKEHESSGSAYNLTSSDILWYDWTIDELAALQKRCSTVFEEGLVWINKLRDGPLLIGERFRTEDKIAIMLGEFVFFSATKVIPTQYASIITNIQNEILNGHYHIPGAFQAVRPAIPGYGCSGTLIYKLPFSGTESHSSYGHSFFDEDKIDMNLLYVDPDKE